MGCEARVIVPNPPSPISAGFHGWRICLRGRLRGGDTVEEGLVVQEEAVEASSQRLLCTLHCTYVYATMYMLE